ncbi:MAG: geranylgeranyl reductase family protein [Actinobacteria bacterium]|nr:geranylgeranyl reductase family protein [Actinomycetota bacterium]
MAPGREDADVLVVGCGPAGAAAAYWLAEHGARVLVAEKKRFPRDKTCGDGLTPRAVKQLEDMGLGGELSRFHRYDGLRATAHGRELELQWPTHPVYPRHGYVVRRRELDHMVARRAVAAGADLREGHEVTEPLMDGPRLAGATLRDVETGATTEVRARYVVVADGANSRFGRALGTARNRDWPYGTAIRTYWTSPRHDEPWIESALDVKDRHGNSMPGYGWIFPVGDGTINVGVGLLSTFKRFRDVNTSTVLDAYAHMIADRWGIDPGKPECRATSGKIPMGGSVGPKTGLGYLVVGDAAGSVNPFNGEGIDYAYETSRIAAMVLAEALAGGGDAALDRYPGLLQDEYGQYFRVARLFARVIGRPVLMRELSRVGIRSHTLMEWVLRIMANLLRPDEIGPAEAAYRAASAIARLAPRA